MSAEPNKNHFNTNTSSCLIVLNIMLYRLSNQARLINDLDNNNTQDYKYLGDVD